MSKFASRAAVLSAPIRTTGVIGVTHEGGIGHARDAKSELFLLAVTNMVGEGTFYEAGKTRDERYARLIAQVTTEDPAWVRAFVPFLRDRLNMRSAALVMAAEYVKAGGVNGRSVVSSALSRADEPAEMLAYWAAVHGRHIPKPVKRGVADAAVRLYNEWAALKYDGSDAKWRMADVLDLTHPTPKAEWQAALFRYLLAKRHKRDELPTEGLPTITANRELEALPLADRRGVLADPDRLKAAAFTWERLSGWLQGPMDAAAWEAIIPSMGYMALLRNLRNFEDAKIAPVARDAVAARLADLAEVAKSRQLPLRFYSAWANVGTLSYGPAIETALDACLANVPAFKGRTLVLIDVSGSMAAPLSDKSKAMRWQVAALFGLAVATRAEKADVVAFQSGTTQIYVRPNTSLLRGVDAVAPFVGGGTDTFGALRAHFADHDRVIIVTDEQAAYGLPIVTKCPIYTFNVAGYKMGHLPSGVDNRYTFGGLTDAAFDLIPLLEQHRSGDWSFLAA